MRVNKGQRAADKVGGDAALPRQVEHSPTSMHIVLLLHWPRLDRIPDMKAQKWCIKLSTFLPPNPHSADRIHSLSGAPRPDLYTLLEDVRVLVRRRKLVVEHRRESAVFGLGVDVGKVPKVPCPVRGRLVFPALTLLVLHCQLDNSCLRIPTDLYSALLGSGEIVVCALDPLGDLLPQPPTLPRTLLLQASDRYLLLDARRCVEEDGTLGTANVADAGPLALVCLERLLVVGLGEGGLESVGLARYPSSTLVVDLYVSFRPGKGTW